MESTPSGPDPGAEPLPQRLRHGGAELVAPDVQGGEVGKVRRPSQGERAQGEVRTLRLQEDHIELKFHGRVRGMTLGSGEGSRSYMPTWLEWLRERHSLSLLWGAALYLFGLVTIVLRWWGKPL